MLRDRLVCGINDQRLQRRLLAESDLTFKKAFDLVQALEAAERNAKDIVKASGVHTVRKLERTEGPRRAPTKMTTTTSVADLGFEKGGFKVGFAHLPRSGPPC